jgi:hypothetical protein
MGHIPLYVSFFLMPAMSGTTAISQMTDWPSRAVLFKNNHLLVRESNQSEKLKKPANLLAFVGNHRSFPTHPKYVLLMRTDEQKSAKIRVR